VSLTAIILTSKIWSKGGQP